MLPQKETSNEMDRPYVARFAWRSSLCRRCHPATHFHVLQRPVRAGPARTDLARDSWL
ncbi:MAG: hypothetical protein GDA44_09660 [Prochloron sp. SP5CPC1]|nr:hypothetical protein [Candidatus Paraprochloron terpiosi SP5CPC1]